MTLPSGILSALCILAYMIISSLFALLFTKEYCYSDKIIESLTYWLLVGLLATSQVFRL